MNLFSVLGTVLPPIGVTRDTVHGLWLLPPFVLWSSIALILWLVSIISTFVVVATIVVVDPLEPVRRIESHADIFNDVNYVASRTLTYPLHHFAQTQPW